MFRRARWLVRSHYPDPRLPTLCSIRTNIAIDSGERPLGADDRAEEHRQTSLICFLYAFFVSSTPVPVLSNRSTGSSRTSKPYRFTGGEVTSFSERVDGLNLGNCRELISFRAGTASIVLSYHGPSAGEGATGLLGRQRVNDPPLPSLSYDVDPFVLTLLKSKSSGLPTLPSLINGTDGLKHVAVFD